MLPFDRESLSLTFCNQRCFSPAREYTYNSYYPNRKCSKINRSFHQIPWIFRFFKLLHWFVFKTVHLHHHYVCVSCLTPLETMRTNKTVYEQTKISCRRRISVNKIENTFRTNANRLI